MVNDSGGNRCGVRVRVRVRVRDCNRDPNVS